ncbi:dynein light chain type 1 domain-containing protein [Ditylenchus destructor]|uniref:Dynein light chain type 1 domain-containing protein n=1 Tax=Ditylenchus destructor TaxID=166010 RepID=A0AAD4R752_9BILA|nr:dynein light chain type 1 domain-containing protein [Ditylenchus destructor]
MASEQNKTIYVINPSKSQDKPPNNCGKYILKSSTNSSESREINVPPNYYLKFPPPDIAEELKKCFDAACPVGPWHCIVGQAFYSITTHRRNYYLFFIVNNLKIILYKCREQD